MFKYEGYAKDPAGSFTKSKLVEVSNKVSYTVGWRTPEAPTGRDKFQRFVVGREHPVHKPKPMTPVERAEVARDVRSELADLTSIPMNEWPMKWRLTDPKYAILRPIHLDQINPLAPNSAKRLWEIIGRSRLHDELPFVSGFFDRMESTSVGNSHGDAEEDGRIRKWLYERGIPFQTQVYLSWQPEWAVRTTWKMLVKYWTDFYYPISDDLTVIDGTFRWALFFWHEHEIFFGTNRWSKHSAEPTGDQDASLSESALSRPVGVS